MERQLLGHGNYSPALRAKPAASFEELRARELPAFYAAAPRHHLQPLPGARLLLSYKFLDTIAYSEWKW